MDIVCVTSPIHFWSHWEFFWHFRVSFTSQLQIKTSQDKTTTQGKHWECWDTLHTARWTCNWDKGTADWTHRNTVIASTVLCLAAPEEFLASWLVHSVRTLLKMKNEMSKLKWVESQHELLSQSGPAICCIAVIAEAEPSLMLLVPANNDTICTYHSDCFQIKVKIISPSHSERLKAYTVFVVDCPESQPLTPNKLWNHSLCSSPC